MLAQKIPAAEQRWFADSFVDPNGRVFEWRGDIYRAVEPAFALRWEEWERDGTIATLIRDGLLIESELTDFTTESGQAVLRHRRVPVVSYCYEWAPPMLKAAALVTLDLCIRLTDKGLTLQDGHPWNVLFQGTTPTYIDAGSIVPARDDILWTPYQQFCNFFLFPLYLYAAGRGRVASWLLRDYLAGVTDEDVLAALPVSFKLRHPRRTLGIALPKWAGKFFERLPEDLQRRFFSISNRVGAESANAKLKVRFFESLRRDVETLPLPSGDSYWARYYGSVDAGCFHSELSPGDWRYKQTIVSEILAKLRAKTVLDVGANTGEYAKLAADHGARVTACELDTGALSLCYEQARKERLDILPLAVNVFGDSPAPGRGGSVGPTVVERLGSELVMALAVIHHVVARQRLSVTRVSQILASLCSRWLLIESVPPLKPRLGASAVAGLDDYTSADLEDCLRLHFKSIERFPSYPEDRRLFLCEK